MTDSVLGVTSGTGFQQPNAEQINETLLEKTVVMFEFHTQGEGHQGHDEHSNRRCAAVMDTVGVEMLRIFEKPVPMTRFSISLIPAGMKTLLG